MKSIHWNPPLITSLALTVPQQCQSIQARILFIPAAETALYNVANQRAAALLYQIPRKTLDHWDRC